MKRDVFLSDPAMDGLLKMVMALAAELHISRSRCRALEGVLVDKGLIAADAVEQWRPDAARDAAGEAELQRMVRNLFAACVGGAPDQEPAS